MAKRVPGSMRTRKSLSELIEGRLSCADGRGELVKLARRLIIEETLEAESRNALGRDYYEHGAAEGQGWRNGVRPGRRKGWWTTRRRRSRGGRSLSTRRSGRP